MSIALQEPPEVSIAAINGESLYELVNGQYEEKPPMSASAMRLAFQIGVELEVFGRRHERGRAVTEALFELNAEKRLWRRPDAAFVSFERWPKETPIPHSDPWPVVPNVAIEALGPTN